MNFKDIVQNASFVTVIGSGPTLTEFYKKTHPDEIVISCHFATDLCDQDYAFMLHHHQLNTIDCSRLKYLLFATENADNKKATDIDLMKKKFNVPCEIIVRHCHDRTTPLSKFPQWPFSVRYDNLRSCGTHIVVALINMGVKNIQAIGLGGAGYTKLLPVEKTYPKRVVDYSFLLKYAKDRGVCLELN